MIDEIRTDFVVVGSGAGGGVTAYHLARAGERVLVIERGRWVRSEEMPSSELEALATLYKDGGAQMNSALSMTLLQGNCVGGSTVLANVVCFRLPEDVRREYADHGIELPPERLRSSYRRVESVLNVHETKEGLLNRAAFRIEAGMRALGVEPRRFQHASIGCNGCGLCNLGCRYGAKMDASRTWIPMAEARGARVMPRTEALRLESRKGRVEALLCRDLDSGRLVRVRAQRYVLSGGAINTPELLLKSGILADRVGLRMSMNAGAMMVAEYPEPLDAFDGIQMGVYHEQDGYTIEQDHNPYLSFCMTQPVWLDRERARRPDLYRYLTSCGVLTPTRSAASSSSPSDGCFAGRSTARKLTSTYPTSTVGRWSAATSNWRTSTWRRERRPSMRRRTSGSRSRDPRKSIDWRTRWPMRATSRASARPTPRAARRLAMTRGGTCSIQGSACAACTTCS